jgi:hypothetical protein
MTSAIGELGSQANATIMLTDGYVLRDDKQLAVSTKMTKKRLGTSFFVFAAAPEQRSANCYTFHDVTGDATDAAGDACAGRAGWQDVAALLAAIVKLIPARLRPQLEEAQGGPDPEGRQALDRLQAQLAALAAAQQSQPPRPAAAAAAPAEAVAAEVEGLDGRVQSLEQRLEGLDPVALQVLHASAGAWLARQAGGPLDGGSSRPPNSRPSAAPVPWHGSE